MKFKLLLVEKDDEEYEKRRVEINMRIPKKTMKSIQDSVNSISSFLKIFDKLN